MKKILMAAAAATVMISGAAYASVTFDSTTGTGFVGKGNVQTLFGWNNKQLQDNATTLAFSYNAENSWTCTKIVELGHGGTNEIVQERNTTVTGVVYTVARENSKGKDGPITGFRLTGYTGGVVTSGPATGSCPATPSGFVYDDNLESSGGLSVNGALLD